MKIPFRFQLHYITSFKFQEKPAILLISGQQEKKSENVVDEKENADTLARLINTR